MELVGKIGLLVKALRDKHGLTQEQLGERVGVTDKAIRNLEKGEDRPQLETLMGVSSAFDMELWELLRLAEAGDDDERFAELAVVIAKASNLTDRELQIVGVLAETLESHRR